MSTSVEIRSVVLDMKNAGWRTRVQFIHFVHRILRKGFLNSTRTYKLQTITFNGNPPAQMSYKASLNYQIPSVWHMQIHGAADIITIHQHKFKGEEWDV
jgi:hypothetical protein